MTLDSITKELMKAWKTSTGWAIALLSAVILGLSIVPGVSLSGLATFGIFFVALQALEFTKEQSKEWRRKDALAHCYEAEKLYKQIKPHISEILEAAFFELDQKSMMFSVRKFIQNYDLETSEKVSQLESTIKTINAHLKEMGKKTINELENLLLQIDGSVLILDIYSHESTEGGEKVIEDTLNEIKKTAEEAGINLEISTGSSMDSYIYDLKYIVLEK